MKTEKNEVSMKKMMSISAILLGMSFASWAMENDRKETEGWMVVEKTGEARCVATPPFVSPTHSPKVLPTIIADGIVNIPPASSTTLLDTPKIGDNKNNVTDMLALENRENDNVVQVMNENEQSISNLNVWVRQCAQWLIAANAAKDKNKEYTASTFTAFMAFSDWSANISND